MLNRRSLLSRSSNDTNPSSFGDLSTSTSNSVSRMSPEINLIPFIDVLLVVLIFLMISTTFTKYQELAIILPSAEGAASSAQTPSEISVAVNQEGRYAIEGGVLDSRKLVEKLSSLSQSWKEVDGVKNGRVIISADARAPHQAVMRVLEAAREAGIANVSFATQSKSKAQRP